MRTEHALRGFTLLELLVTIAIMGVVAGIVGVSLYASKVEADRNATKIQMSSVAKALELYRLKFNRFPSTSEGLAARLSPPAGAPLIDGAPTDAWGAELIYVAPGVHNGARFDLQSKGPDGVPDTDDDVASWAVSRTGAR